MPATCVVTAVQGDPVQFVDQAVRGDGPFDQAAEAFTGVFVHDRDDLHGSAVGGGTELKVHRPDPVGRVRRHSWFGAPGWTSGCTACHRMLHRSRPSNGVARVTNLVQGSDVTGTRGIGIVGNGDSGGPVISPTGDGGVLARGVISGMATGSSFEQPCQGYVPPGRVCSRVVYFADLQNVMARVGVRLNTATG